MCDEFAAANPEKTYTFTYGVVSEADAQKEVNKDISAAADVFAFASDQTAVKSNMVYTLCKHMVYMLSITNEHKNELEMRAKPEWKVHFLCFASAKRGSFSIR